MNMRLVFTVSFLFFCPQVHIVAMIVALSSTHAKTHAQTIDVDRVGDLPQDIKREILLPMLGAESMHKIKTLKNTHFFSASQNLTPLLISPDGSSIARPGYHAGRVLPETKYPYIFFCNAFFPAIGAGVGLDPSIVFAVGASLTLAGVKAASSFYYYTTKIYNVDAGKVVLNEPPHGNYYWYACFNDKDKTFNILEDVGGGWYTFLRRTFDCKTGECLYAETARHAPNPVRKPRMVLKTRSRDKSMWAAVKENAVHVGNIATGQRLVFHDHTAPIEQIHLNHDASQLISISGHHKKNVVIRDLTPLRWTDEQIQLLSYIAMSRELYDTIIDKRSCIMQLLQPRKNRLVQLRTLLYGTAKVRNLDLNDLTKTFGTFSPNVKKRLCEEYRLSDVC